jgi:hypothetical protein
MINSKIKKTKLNEKKSTIRPEFNWKKYLTIFIMSYTIMSALFYFASTEGYPNYMDSKYLLMNHGEIIREISEYDYNMFKTYQKRLSSSYILLFSFVSLYLMKEKLDN